MENLHDNQNQSRLLIVNYGYNKNNIKQAYKNKTDKNATGVFLPFIRLLGTHLSIYLSFYLIVYQVTAPPDT